MSKVQVELEWVQQCAVCGCEHRHLECRSVAAEDTAETTTAAFRERCQRWYRAHVEATQALQALGVNQS
jgi:hypothetical protein